MLFIVENIKTSSRKRERSLRRLPTREKETDARHVNMLEM
jgi:hypothetical protein